jgi:DTW domain-containing protein YfiP
MSELEPRRICQRCRRPEVVCYCAHVREIETRTRVVILQHPRERDVPINTARIAALCLPNSELHVGVRFGGTKALARAMGDSERPPILLYPTPDALDIETHPPDSPRTLIVLDGTWWQASKLWKENPELAAIPRYAFRPPAPSDYRIRKEPRDDYVSTLEALAHVLGVLEGDKERLLSMREPFRAMVDAQLSHAAKGGGSRHVTRSREQDGPNKGPWARLPRALREYRLRRETTLLCVHGEANGWPYGSPERTSEREEVIHWLAHRLDTGETFERVVRTRGSLAYGTAKHCRLTEDEIASGVTFEELVRDFSAFARPTDLLCSWGAYAPLVYQRQGGELPQAQVDVRIAGKRFVQTKPSPARSMSELAVHLGATPGAPLGRGRGGERLAELSAIVRAMVVEGAAAAGSIEEHAR